MLNQFWKICIQFSDVFSLEVITYRFLSSFLDYSKAFKILPKALSEFFYKLEFK